MFSVKRAGDSHRAIVRSVIAPARDAGMGEHWICLASLSDGGPRAPRFCRALSCAALSVKQPSSRCMYFGSVEQLDVDNCVFDVDLLKHSLCKIPSPKNVSRKELECMQVVIVCQER